MPACSCSDPSFRLIVATARAVRFGTFEPSARVYVVVPSTGSIRDMACCKGQLNKPREPSVNDAGVLDPKLGAARSLPCPVPSRALRERTAWTQACQPSMTWPRPDAPHQGTRKTCRERRRDGLIPGEQGFTGPLFPQGVAPQHPPSPQRADGSEVWSGRRRQLVHARAQALPAWHLVVRLPVEPLLTSRQRSAPFALPAT